MQQRLPLAVLKLEEFRASANETRNWVATALTACGIETPKVSGAPSNSSTVATALTACGIETHERFRQLGIFSCKVATVLTACGIETLERKGPLYGCLVGRLK